MKFRTFLAMPIYFIATIFIVIAWIIGGDEMQEFIKFHLMNIPLD